MKTKKTWILVADHSGARVLENHGPEKGLLEVPDMYFTQQGETPDTTHRYYIPAMRHRFLPGLCATDWPRDPAQERFAREVAEALNEKYREGAFDRLVLAGSPRMLQHLRYLLSTDTRRCLKAEVPGLGKGDVAKRIDPDLLG
ncbi:MAG TPA: host attachment protein [Devosiaceae bacterium]